MQENKISFEQRLDKLFNILIWVIISVGIALRITVYFQNRTLIIDEVNIARNLHERGYFELLKPLKYEQYAPPVFLWIEKLSTQLFGFGELGMKLYPLITGIAALFLLRKVLLKLMPARAAWLPVLLMAVTYYYIVYSTSVKQYMPDAMITLILVWLTLTYDITTTKRSKFIAIWVVAGSLAVWSSMPSVFVLAGVGCYYGWVSMRNKWQGFSALCISVAAWVLNFAAYYFFILKSQVGLKNLQDYHAKYFLFAWPDDAQEWQHNKLRIREVIQSMGGYNYYYYCIYGSLLLIGMIALFTKRTQLFLLLIVPFGLTLIAAAFNQFSLIERVILFMMPLLLIAFGYGFALLMKIRYLVVQLMSIVLGILIVQHYNEFKFFREPMPSAEITKGFDYILRSGVGPADMFIHHASRPTYIYYTSMHPRNEAHRKLVGARELDWDDNYGSIMRFYKGQKAYFLFTGGMDAEETAKRNAELANSIQVDSFKAFTCEVKVYVHKPGQ
jgi:4-amino-4-deoxy-L-arabinose transferase-like glycosyltransferase